MRVDVLIVVATLAEEKAIVKNDSWILQDNLEYGYYTLEENGITYALIRGEQYGKLDAAVIIAYFMPNLNPTILAMAGFAAGKKGEINLGDIIVAEKIYDYDGGKNYGENNVAPEIDLKSMNGKWKQLVERMNDNWRNKIQLSPPKDFDLQLIELLNLLADEKSHFLENVYSKEKFPDWKTLIEDLEERGFISINGKKLEITKKGLSYINRIGVLFPDGYEHLLPSIKVGVLATGSQVQECDEIFHELEKKDRKTYALDMEAIAIAKSADTFAIPFIVAKGIGDYARQGKHFANRYIEYACHSSCRFIIEFTQERVIVDYLREHGQELNAK